MRRFDGRTAIVTGASRGIGLAIAQRLVDEGAKVVVTARKQEALDEAVAALGGPEHALAVAGRSDDADHQDETIVTAIETFGSADLLVNNTGINPAYGPLMQLDLDAARKILEVNGIAALSWVQKLHAAGWASTAARSSTSPRSPASSPPRASRSTARARRCSSTSPRSSPSSSARPSGSTPSPRRRQDPLRHRALRGPRGGGLGRLPAQAARRARGHRLGRRVPPLG